MRRNPRSGFSTVELIAVVAIIGLMAGVAVPRFTQMIQQSRVKAAATQLETAVGQARRLAVTLRSPCRVSLDISGDRHITECLESTNTALIPNPNKWQPIDTLMRRGTTEVWYPLDADLQSNANPFNDVDGDGYLDIVFLRDGSLADNPTLGAPTTTLTFSPPPVAEIRFASDSITFNRYTFVAHKSGKVKVTPLRI